MHFDECKQEQFVGHAMADLKGGLMMLMTNIGDRLGLFRALAERPMTSRELAETAGLQERYVREWLSSVTGDGYVEYDPTTETCTLPAEHAPVLVNASSPVFFGGLYTSCRPCGRSCPR